MVIVHIYILYDIHLFLVCDFTGMADSIGRKCAIIVGGVVFFIGGAVQAGSIALW